MRRFAAALLALIAGAVPALVAPGCAAPPPPASAQTKASPDRPRPETSEMRWKEREEGHDQSER